ncbi:hypothetical protein [Bradymonas sediminis]|uniref:Uncharacterized protein n=1 Tax=Bradymonas sediminis TaxID=1548548 RepID=A0A2Z4FMR7_9DELT|nr:hypothetical protein [Bradymonas sediminis]AWV90130.1 hypothetical protein DN745_12625 [Bradymonas sediminis]TDP75901.1 hypothetical protein DFR33_103248 [Bradymonas sediminis]
MKDYLFNLKGRINLVVVARRVMALAALTLVLGMSNYAQAGGPMGRTLGVGLALGNPTSFTGKYHVSDSEAIDVHLGLFHSYGRSYWGNSLFLGGDYLFDLWTFVENGSITVPFYAGPGLGLLFDTRDYRDCRYSDRFRCGDYGYYDFGFGPRMPIGVGIEFNNAPFELFLEMTPSMMILVRDANYGDRVSVRFDIPNFALIARFYFE